MAPLRYRFASAAPLAPCLLRRRPDLGAARGTIGGKGSKVGESFEDRWGEEWWRYDAAEARRLAPIAATVAGAVERGVTVVLTGPTGSGKHRVAVLAAAMARDTANTGGEGGSSSASSFAVLTEAELLAMPPLRRQQLFRDHLRDRFGPFASAATDPFSTSADKSSASTSDALNGDVGEVSAAASAVGASGDRPPPVVDLFIGYVESGIFMRRSLLPRAAVRACVLIRNTDLPHPPEAAALYLSARLGASVVAMPPLSPPIADHTCTTAAAIAGSTAGNGLMSALLSPLPMPTAALAPHAAMRRLLASWGAGPPLFPPAAYPPPLSSPQSLTSSHQQLPVAGAEDHLSDSDRQKRDKVEKQQHRVVVSVHVCATDGTAEALNTWLYHRSVAANAFPLAGRQFADEEGSCEDPHNCNDDRDVYDGGSMGGSLFNRLSTYTAAPHRSIPLVGTTMWEVAHSEVVLLLVPKEQRVRRDSGDGGRGLGAEGYGTGFGEGGGGDLRTPLPPLPPPSMYPLPPSSAGGAPNEGSAFSAFLHPQQGGVPMPPPLSPPLPPHPSGLFGESFPPPPPEPPLPPEFVVVGGTANLSPPPAAPSSAFSGMYASASVGSGGYGGSPSSFAPSSSGSFSSVFASSPGDSYSSSHFAPPPPSAAARLRQELQNVVGAEWTVVGDFVPPSPSPLPSSTSVNPHPTDITTDTLSPLYASSAASYEVWAVRMPQGAAAGEAVSDAMLRRMAMGADGAAWAAAEAEAEEHTTSDLSSGGEYGQWGGGAAAYSNHSSGVGSCGYGYGTGGNGFTAEGKANGSATASHYSDKDCGGGDAFASSSTCGYGEGGLSAVSAVAEEPLPLWVRFVMPTAFLAPLRSRWMEEWRRRQEAGGGGSSGGGGLGSGWGSHQEQRSGGRGRGRGGGRGGRGRVRGGRGFGGDGGNDAQQQPSELTATSPQTKLLMRRSVALPLCGGGPSASNGQQQQSTGGNSSNTISVVLGVGSPVLYRNRLRVVIGFAEPPLPSPSDSHAETTEAKADGMREALHAAEENSASAAVLRHSFSFFDAPLPVLDGGEIAEPIVVAGGGEGRRQRGGGGGGYGSGYSSARESSASAAVDEALGGNGSLIPRNPTPYPFSARLVVLPIRTAYAVSQRQLVSPESQRRPQQNEGFAGGLRSVPSSSSSDTTNGSSYGRRRMGDSDAAAATNGGEEGRGEATSKPTDEPTSFAPPIFGIGPPPQVFAALQQPNNENFPFPSLSVHGGGKPRDTFTFCARLNPIEWLVAAESAAAVLEAEAEGSSGHHDGFATELQQRRGPPPRHQSRAGRAAAGAVRVPLMGHPHSDAAQHQHHHHATAWHRTAGACLPPPSLSHFHSRQPLRTSLLASGGIVAAAAPLHPLLSGRGPLLLKLEAAGFAAVEATHTPYYML